MLEPRVMLDGAAVVDGIDTLTQSSPALLSELGLTTTQESSEQADSTDTDALYLAPTSSTQPDEAELGLTTTQESSEQADSTETDALYFAPTSSTQPDEAELGLTATQESSEQADSTDTDALSLAPNSGTQSDRRNELVFIDSRVDLSSVEEIPTDRTFVIASDVNAFAYTAEIIGSFEQVDAIHVISHGADGELLLGNETYLLNNLETYRADLSALGSGLTESGDILFYACDLAATDDGREFIQKLSLNNR